MENPQIQPSIQNTPIEHLPNTSQQEEDLVNKILNELDENDVKDEPPTFDTSVPPPQINIPRQRPKQPQMFPAKNKTHHNVTEYDDDDMSESLPPLKKTNGRNRGAHENRGILTTLYRSIDVDSLLLYMKHAVLACVLFLFFSVFADKIKLFVARIPSTFYDEEMTKLGHVFYSIVFGIFYYFLSLIALK